MSNYFDLSSFNKEYIAFIAFTFLSICVLNPYLNAKKLTIYIKEILNIIKNICYKNTLLQIKFVTNFQNIFLFMKF